MKSDVISTIQTLVQTLTGIPTALLQTSEETAQFCERACFDPVQQFPTQEYLQGFLPQLQNNFLYQVTDALLLNYNVIKADGTVMVMGPYCTWAPDEAVCETILARAGLSVSLLAPYQLYRTRYPLVMQKTAWDAAHCALTALSGGPMAETCAVTLKPQAAAAGRAVLEDLRPQYQAKMVEERYQLERKMDAAIAAADTKEALLLLDALIQRTNTIFMAPDSLWSLRTQFTIARTTIRKAVDTSLVPPIVIDAQTEICRQKLNQAKTAKEMEQATRQLLIDLCEAVKKARRAHYGPIVRRAADYIALNLSAPLTVEGLAGEMGVSPTYLCTLFRQDTGDAPLQYIHRRRAEKAAALLRSSNLPIQEISQYVGFTDNNYFVKVFRKFYSTTPSAYRKAGTSA